MTIRHIRIFLGVCDHHYNTTHAAEALHMTQPAVSLAIRELEQYYGVKLFDWMGRRLVLTETGQRFLSYARRISGLVEDMDRELRNWDQLGLLRVGASITIGAQFLPSYVRTFSQLHPKVDVRAEVVSSDLLEERLIDNKLDFALMEGVPRSPAIHCEEYMEDHLTVICPRGGPFSQGQVITPEEFKSQRFLLRERGSGTREEFEQVAAAAGISITPSWEAMSTTALVNGVICGLGITVLPYRMVLGPLERGLVVSVRVDGLRFTRRFRIAYHKDKFLTPLSKSFIDLCRRYALDYPLPPYNGLY